MDHRFGHGGGDNALIQSYLSQSYFTSWRANQELGKSGGYEQQSSNVGKGSQQ
jgi:hypothetical protein